MITHNICFMEKYGKWSLNDLQIPTIFVPSRIHVLVRISPQVGLKPTTQWSKVARINHCTTMMLQTVKYSDIYKLMSRSNLPVKILPDQLVHFCWGPPRWGYRVTGLLRLALQFSVERNETLYDNQQNECAPSEDSRSGWASAKSDQSLRVRMKKPWVLSYPLRAQRGLWSDWVDAQADLSLRWVHTHFVGFVMSWLKINYINYISYLKRKTF